MTENSAKLKPYKEATPSSKVKMTDKELINYLTKLSNKQDSMIAKFVTFHDAVWELMGVSDTSNKPKFDRVLNLSNTLEKEVDMVLFRKEKK